MVKCVCCYMSLGSNGCFAISIALIGSHYMMYIINSVGHLRLDSVKLLVLWMVAYNGQGVDVVLQVSRNNAIPTENG